MWLQIQATSSVPIYQQVTVGIKMAVVKGILRPGDKLPAVRELAIELAINHNTVAKAYQELERDHVIEVIRGRGTFVAVRPTVPNAQSRGQNLRDLLFRLVVEAHHLQMSDADIRHLLEDVLVDVHRSPHEEEA